eukprot:jgi/Tetstr1/436452/TSEL_025280.t1
MMDEDVMVDAGVAVKVSTSDGLGRLSSELLELCEATFRLSRFVEFCHYSENISPLEATIATVVRYVAWIEYQYNFRALVASVVNIMFFAMGLRACPADLCKGAASAANAIGAPLSHIRYQGGWATNSDVVMDYIDPNVLPSPGAWFFFGHIVPLRHFQVQQDSAAVAFPVPPS